MTATHATTAAVADKLPRSLDPICDYRQSVDCLTDDINTASSVAIVSLLLLLLKSEVQKDKCNGEMKTPAPSNKAPDK